MDNEISSALLEFAGRRLGKEFISASPVSGGDINKAFCLHTSQEKLFLKWNVGNRFPAMFQKEANGLAALAKNGIRTPEVIDVNSFGSHQYLILQWVETGKRAPGFWNDLGTMLAELHGRPQDFYGWPEDNYIGSLVQQNRKMCSWPSFYGECRIMPLVAMLRDNGSFDRKTVAQAETFCKRLNAVFPSEPPSLLHGDLWAGNFMIDHSGNPLLIDPAVYFGHREMDIGMSLLFGGFDEEFYQAYQLAYPLEKGWEQRLDFTQLYPLLVHGVLFGGHYVSTCRSFFEAF